MRIHRPSRPFTGISRHALAVAIAVSSAASSQPRAAEPGQGGPAPALIPPPGEEPPPQADDLAGLATPEGLLGYALGLRIGRSILADFKTQGTEVDPAALARGLADGVLDARPLVAEEKLAGALDSFERQMRKLERERLAKLADAARRNRAAGTAFLRQNAARNSVRSLPSGLQVEVVREGDGPRPTIDDTVTTRYVGTHIDGSRFDATDPQGEPATFPLRGVVPAWQEALPMMRVGSKWKLYVPPELAYGDAGDPPVIEPNEVLIFEIELLGIEGR